MALESRITAALSCEDGGLSGSVLFRVNLVDIAREDQCRLPFQAVLQRFAAACTEASPAARSLERRFSYEEALCRLRKDQADQAD